MNRITQAAIAAAGLLALAGCAQNAAPVDTAADVATIHAATNAWVEAYNAGDADKIVALYADDAIMMPPDAPPLRARGDEGVPDADMAASKAPASASRSIRMRAGSRAISPGTPAPSTWPVRTAPASHRQVRRGLAQGRRQVADDQGRLEQRCPGRRRGARPPARFRAPGRRSRRAPARRSASGPGPPPRSCGLRAPRARSRAPARARARRRRTPCTRAPCWRCRP